MLSSSASRREAAAARAAKSGELPKSAGISWKDVAAAATATTKNGELSKAVAAVREAAAVHHEGWMVRYGRRKIGRSFFHTRYFVLESRLLAYYKKKPKDNMVPLKSLLIDGNCRVEDRGLKTHHGQKPDPTAKTHKAFATMDFDMELGGQFSLSDRDSAAEEEEERPTLIRRKTIGNGPPDSVHDWTKDADFGLSNQNDPTQLYSKKNWRLLRCQNGKSVFLSLGGTVAFARVVWLKRLMVTPQYYIIGCNCIGVQGSSGLVIFVMFGIGGVMMMEAMLCYFDLQNIQTVAGSEDMWRVQDLSSQVSQWKTPYSGLREYFSQTDDIHITPRIPAMESMVDVASSQKDEKPNEVDPKTKPADQEHAENKNMGTIDEESDDDEDYQVPEADIEEGPNKSDNDAKPTDEPPEKIDLSCFSGILHHDPEEKSRNCWAVPDSKLFKVRSKNFPHDKSKVPASSYLMELAAIDWFKDTKRMDNVGRQKNCVAQVATEKGMHTFVVNLQIPGSTHYSLVMYFVTSSLKKGSLLQRFFDGDDDFRNSRLKLIPSVPKGSWIVRQSVGSTPCLLGKAVDCSYVRGPGYLEVDVDIGSSAVANGVLGLVFGVVTTLVVDMAFLIQANTYEELPEQVIGAARLAHVEPSTAVVPDLDNNSESNKDNSSNEATSSEDDSSKKTN
ncbi:Protein ENHANCED DISEASE RESISTANCE 2-like [Dichanthelium oligosanthes]|uniref:Protein ENHANCED DISEASE RESISTANCE 2-like n=1 Tax=Dichanthelium oligosanthes TaxID=888268 RepID=A0A1E5UUC0_9POAL|nr:Protein ENHANCED DISEASE RESISTANCE 2-like [Dichanthelium oligosanthes]